MFDMKKLNNDIFDHLEENDKETIVASVNLLKK
jgi:hypothetical protein